MWRTCRTSAASRPGSTLKRLGVSPEGATEQIQRIIGPGHSADSATLGITPRTKRVLEAARKEARRLGYRCADTEHLLLAVSETEGAAELRTPARRRLLRSRA